MAWIELSVGVEIPNHNMESKTDGAGQTGVPDGWSKTSPMSDVTACKTIPLQVGRSDTVASPFYGGSGKALWVSVPAAMSTNSGRYVQSPVTRAGHFLGQEQYSYLALGGWRYRLRWLTRGIWPTGTPAGGYFVLRVVVFDASETNSVTFSSSSVAGDYNVGWFQKTLPFDLNNTGWSPAVGVPDHAYVRLVFLSGHATNAFQMAFSSFTLESLGPVDMGDGSETLHNPAKASRYFIARNPRWKGLVMPEIFGMGKAQRLPSGARRYFDPSGGIKRRRFEFPFNILSRDDYYRLWLLWMANKGYWVDSGTAYGKPLPIVLSPNQPDDVGSYYVDFADETFPLELDDEFQASTMAATRYKGIVKLEER